MTVTVLKTTFPKADPKIISFRDASQYSQEDFGNDLKRNLEIIEGGKYDDFEDVLKNTLNYYAPEKKVTVRANHKPYVMYQRNEESYYAEISIAK